MKSLFFKLFLGFWLTSLAVAFGAHFITRQVYEHARGEERYGFAQAWREQQATAAAAILSARGDAALRDWLAPFVRRPGIAGRLHLLAADGTALAGPPLPHALREAFAARPSGSARVTHANAMFVRLEAPGTAERWLAWRVRREPAPPRGFAPLPSFGRDWRLPPGLALTRFAAALVLSAAVCYGLARHFSRPVHALRAASAAVSRGDLAARVPAPFTSRRDELGALAEDFNRMAESIAQIVESRNQLLRDVSHELRSPLARLEVALELARKRGGEAPALDRIAEEAARLDALIAQVLILARLENAPGTLAREMVDLAQLISGVVGDAAFEAARRDIRVAWQPGAACPVQGDPNLLRSVLENVVRNAVVHPPAGTDVRVSLACESRACRVTVEDSGPGVPAETLARIFEPFVRGDPARVPAGGSGLGLAIARRAVESHGGRIHAHNRAEGGFIVEIELPRAIAAA
ncbi:MAG: sensor histidine kinase [Gammaproteobacteria bacterium]